MNEAQKFYIALVVMGAGIAVTADGIYGNHDDERNTSDIIIRTFCVGTIGAGVAAAGACTLLLVRELFVAK